ncbi:MAG: (d)CMP kinase [Gemmatimonadales bacterium]
MTAPRVIAIDGPSASGKSSTGAAVATALGLTHVDSGALYRALAWVSLEEGTEDPERILRAAIKAGIELVHIGGALEVRAAGRDLAQILRTPEVSAGASRVAGHPLLRDWVNRQLRSGVAEAGGAVLDGRDIGTVVFPDAALKIFLTASPEARALRRLLQRGDEVDAGQLLREAATLAERDRRDAARPVAPLAQAADAILVDSTSLTLTQQVERIVGLARDRGLLPA